MLSEYLACGFHLEQRMRRRIRPPTLLLKPRGARAALSTSAEAATVSLAGTAGHGWRSA